MLVKEPKAKVSQEGVKLLMELIEESERKDRGYFQFMAVLRDMLRGKHWENLKMSAKKREQTKMVINLAHAHVRTLLPTLFFQNPSVKCYPTVPQQQGKEQTWETAVNATLERIDFASEAEEVVFDSIVYPEGVLKWVKNNGEEDTQITSPTKNAEHGKRGPTAWLHKDTPAAVRLSPIQLIVDYKAPGRDLRDARFVAIRYRKNLAELHYDERYKLPKEWKPNPESSAHPLRGSDREDPFDQWDGSDTKPNIDTDQSVTIYEVWIKELVSDNGVLMHREQVVWLLEGYEKPIRQAETWETMLGTGVHEYPVDRLVLLPIPDDLPASELGVQQSMQLALNWIMSRMVNLLEQEKVIFEIDTAKLKSPSKVKKQIASGKSIEYIEVNEAGAINMVQPSFVSRDNYQLASMLQGFIQQVGGVSANRRGSSGVRTATEASLIEQGMQIKTDQKVNTVARFLKRNMMKMMRMLISIIRSSENKAWVIRLIGETGKIGWAEFTTDEIDWMPDVEIEVDSFRQRDRQEEIQKYMMAWQVLVQAKQMQEPVRLDIAMKQFFEVLGIRDIDKMLFSSQDEMLQQSMEIVMLVLGMPAKVSPDDNHPLHRNVIQAFKNTPVYEALNPEARDAIEQHDAMHEAAIMQAQESQGGPSYGDFQNPFENGQVMVPTEANVARQATAQDRIGMNMPGTGGQIR